MITIIGIPNEQRTKPRKIRITFNEEEIIINPEDVDPSVGRFRNMVESTIIPKKRPRNDMGKNIRYTHERVRKFKKKTGHKLVKKIHQFHEIDFLIFSIKIIILLAENGKYPKKISVKLVYFLSRVFWPGLF